MRRPRAAVVMLLASHALLPAHLARAGDADGDPTGPAFASRPALEWWVTSAAGALWFTTAGPFKPQLAPEECRWCDSNAFDDAAGELAWSSPRSADVTSDVISYGVMPALTAGMLTTAALQEGERAALPTDLVIVAEAVVAAGLVGELLRFTTGRERPSVAALSADAKLETDRPEENNLSFFSGHAATSTALAVSGGMVASRRGRRLAPVVWAAGLALAGATSYLRIASDEHYATDVLAGVSVGAAIGVVVPLLHARWR